MKTKIVALYERLAQKNNRIIEDQKEQLEEYAEDHGYTNCCHYTDNGFSGTSTDRIAFQAMMLAIERDEIDTVIVSTLSRLSRDYEFLFGTLYPLLEKHGVNLLAVDGSSELHNVYESKSFLGCLAEMDRKNDERTA